MIQRNLEQEALDAQVERDYEMERLAKKQAHELALANLKLKARPTIDGRTKVITTLLKAPAFPVVVVCITILSLRGKSSDVLDAFLRT